MVDFRKSKPQRYKDPWRNKVRILRYKGKCIGCGSRCYGFDDGENDPRGVLTERHSADSVGPYSDRQLRSEHVACFGCTNDEPRYRWALSQALRAEEAARLKMHRIMAQGPHVEGRDFVIIGDEQ